VPIGVAYAVGARSAGLTVFETQLVSLTVFSAGVQLSAVSLIQMGASPLALLSMTLVLNLYHILLGLSLGQRLALTRAQRWIAAYLLNDGAYGVTMTSPSASFPFLLGAELSMFVVWNAATWLGAITGPLLPDPGRLGVDFVVPLLFLALLIPRLRSSADMTTAATAATLAIVVGRFGPSSIAVLCAVIVASVIGGWRTGVESVGTPKAGLDEQRS
jgi:predicted branched-subunit amino acid permease